MSSADPPEPSLARFLREIGIRRYALFGAATGLGLALVVLAVFVWLPVAGGGGSLAWSPAAYGVLAFVVAVTGGLLATVALVVRRILQLAGAEREME